MNHYNPRPFFGLISGMIAIEFFIATLTGQLAFTLPIAAVLIVLTTSTLALIWPLPTPPQKRTRRRRVRKPKPRRA